MLDFAGVGWYINKAVTQGGTAFEPFEVRKRFFKNLKKVLDNLLVLCYDKLPATERSVRACTLKIKQCKKLKAF